MKTCGKCKSKLTKMSWRSYICEPCNCILTDVRARPPYLDQPMYEHPVFQQGGGDSTHALARELWDWALELERRLGDTPERRDVL